MMKRILTILGTAFLLFHLLFLWIYTNIDGYFYWAIGQYFKTGSYPFVSPFIYARPTTISPPLYGLFLAFIGSVPYGDVFLHAINILCMATSTLLLFQILKKIVSPNSAAFISFLFLIFPTNVIYTNSMMTELPAQTAVTYYLYLLQNFMKTHKTSQLGYAVLLTAVMTLLKYQFIVLFVFTLFYLLISLWKSKMKNIFPLICTMIGMLIIGFWIITNHSITGVWGLSDTQKMPFYTNFVWDGKHFPKDTNPSVITLRRYVPASFDRYAEYWDLQDYILPYTHREWRSVDEVLGSVGIAAIREHPIEYFTNGIRVFVQTLGSHAPWWHNLQTYGSVDPVQPLFCDHLSSIRFCQPIIKTPISYRAWNAYVSVSRTLYDLFIPPLLLFLFLPSLIITLIDTRWHIRIYSIIYLVNLIPISYLSMVESRYLIPYYPLIIIITAFGIKKIRSLVLHFTAQTHDKN